MEPQNTPAQTNGNGKKIGIGIAVVAILAILGITLASKKPATEESTPVDTGTSSATPATSGTATTTTAPTSTGTAEYKDGTYTATGSYISPGGPDKVGVSVTLKNDIITDATVTAMPGDPMSAKYQAMFVSGYKQYVVGQDITKLNVHKVSGSSLTSGGFNDAITQIEAQAKA